MKIQSGNHIPGKFFCLCLFHPIVQGSKENVIINRGAEDLLIHILHHDANSLPDDGKIFPGIHPKDSHASILGDKDAHEVLEQGGLSAAIRSENRDSFSLIDDKVESADLDLGHIGIDMSNTIHFYDSLPLRHSPILPCNESCF